MGLPSVISSPVIDINSLLLIGGFVMQLIAIRATSAKNNVLIIERITRVETKVDMAIARKD